MNNFSLNLSGKSINSGIKQQKSKLLKRNKTTLKRKIIIISCWVRNINLIIRRIFEETLTKLTIN